MLWKVLDTGFQHTKYQNILENILRINMKKFVVGYSNYCEKFILDLSINIFQIRSMFRIDHLLNTLLLYDKSSVHFFLIKPLIPKSLFLARIIVKTYRGKYEVKCL